MPQTLSYLRPDKSKGFAVTIGNFDGVHLGHQKLIETIKRDCERDHLELVVISFSPHPRVLLCGDKGFVLSSREDKVRKLHKSGADHIIILEFNKEMSQLSASQFADDYIVSLGETKRLYMGYDFSFGRGKEGDFNFAKDYLGAHAIEVHQMSCFTQDGKVTSSSSVRELLHRGEVSKARLLLGENYSLGGEVIHGEHRGRGIGFPTANIKVNPERLVPGRGVYGVFALIENRKYLGVLNIGYNPTFTDNKEIKIEVHILDFDEDIYGKEIDISFFERIRDEKKFDSRNSLVEQINKDIATAKACLND